MSAFLIMLAVLATFLVPPLWMVERVVSAESTAVAFVQGGDGVLEPATVQEARALPLVTERTGFTPMMFLALVLLAGSGFQLVRFWRTRRSFAKACRQGERQPASNLVWTERLGPCVFGLFRPSILMPQSLRDIPEDKLNLILVHEREHIRRKDAWSRAFQNFMLVLFWFHPLVWILSRRIDLLRELAVDEAIVRQPDVSPRAYYDLLVSVSETGFAPRAVIAMARPSTLRQRVEACCRPTPSRRGFGWLAACLPVLGLLLLPGGCTSVPATTLDKPFPISGFDLEPPAEPKAFSSTNNVEARGAVRTPNWRST